MQNISHNIWNVLSLYELLDSINATAIHPLLTSLNKGMRVKQETTH